MLRFLILPAALALCSCNLVQPEVRIGAAQGIPSITGTAEVDLSSFVCGNAIPAGAYEVTTKVVADGCELSFDKDVDVLASTDYTRIPELSSGTTLLQTVELKITQLAFVDATTNVALDPATRMKSASFSVNGQLIGDKSTLSALPKTVTLQGTALAPLKSKIDQKQPATVHATSVVVLPDSPPPPKKMRIEYDAQPTLVLGTGEIKF
jgi:hypothetical protein